MSNFDKAFDRLMIHEGGYVNNPVDPGGETNFGVTAKVARECGYYGPIREMTKEQAKDIYATKYWLPALDGLPYVVAFQIFDMSVNSGVWQAVRTAQRAIGVADDGKMGAITLQKLNSMVPSDFVILFNAERLSFMTLLSSWPHFSKGWVNRITSNLKMAVQK
jgi:lysozyme family protein